MTSEFLQDGGGGRGIFWPEEQKSVSQERPIHDITLEWSWVASPSVKTYRNCLTFSTHIPPTRHSFSV